MEVPPDHQAASHWGLSAGGAEDIAAAAPPGLPGDSYFHPGMDSNANHVNSYYTSPAAARAVHGYRTSHGR